MYNIIFFFICALCIKTAAPSEFATRQEKIDHIEHLFRTTDKTPLIKVHEEFPTDDGDAVFYADQGIYLAYYFLGHSHWNRLGSIYEKHKEAKREDGPLSIFLIWHWDGYISPLVSLLSTTADKIHICTQKKIATYLNRAAKLENELWSQRHLEYLYSLLNTTWMQHTTQQAPNTLEEMIELWQSVSSIMAIPDLWNDNTFEMISRRFFYYPKLNLYILDFHDSEAIKTLLKHANIKGIQQCYLLTYFSIHQDDFISSPESWLLELKLEQDPESKKPKLKQTILSRRMIQLPYIRPLTEKQAKIIKKLQKEVLGEKLTTNEPRQITLPSNTKDGLVSHLAESKFIYDFNEITNLNKYTITISTGLFSSEEAEIYALSSQNETVIITQSEHSKTALKKRLESIQKSPALVSMLAVQNVYIIFEIENNKYLSPILHLVKLENGKLHDHQLIVTYHNNVTKHKREKEKQTKFKGFIALWNNEKVEDSDTESNASIIKTVNQEIDTL